MLRRKNCAAKRSTRTVGLLGGILTHAVGRLAMQFIVVVDGVTIPVLAGSTAYAIGEGRCWKVGLSRKPKEAIAFYSVLGFSGLCGIGLNFTPIDPIQALYWSAVVNGVLAAPVMVILMVLARRPNVMGKLVVTGPLYWLGWASTIAMAFCIVGTIATMFLGSAP